MHKLKFLLIFIFGFFSLSFADETLTITTYYPSPYGVYRELRAQRIAIGDDYINGATYCWEGTCTNTIAAAADLVVEGNVGIGTVNPQAKLHIRGGALRITDGEEDSQPNEISANLSDPSSLLYTLRGSHRFVINSDNYSPENGDNFDVYNVSISSVPLLRVNTAGNVGIGTTSPGAKLYVKGDTVVERLGVGRMPSHNLHVTASSDGTNDVDAVARFGEYLYGRTNLYLGVNTAEGYSYVGSVKTSMFYNNLALAPNGGNVGIGTTAPTRHFEVSGSDPVQANIQSSSADATVLFLTNTNATTQTWGLGVAGGTHVSGIPDGSIYLRDETSANNRFVINTSGNVGIGMTSPSYQLQLSTDSAAKPGTNTWTIASDSRLKKDIRPYTNGLKIIKQINPVWFKYNGKGGLPQDNQEHIGVIGQEIIKVAPYTVNTFKAKLNPEDKESTELLNFNSHALTFDLINAVKELSSELENLKTRLSRLEARK